MNFNDVAYLCSVVSTNPGSDLKTLRVLTAERFGRTKLEAYLVQLVRQKILVRRRAPVEQVVSPGRPRYLYYVAEKAE